MIFAGGIPIRKAQVVGAIGVSGEAVNKTMRLLSWRSIILIGINGEKKKKASHF